MKKLFLSAAALLCASVYSFASGEGSGTVIDFEAIGRIESNPQFTLGSNSKFSHNFANSCLYTNLDMSFGEHWHINMVNHWLNTDSANRPYAATPDLYKDTFWRSTSNWLDYLYVDFKTGGWTIRLGKDCQAIAGWEYDMWDWDVVYDMSTSFWQNNLAYRWGGSLLWTSASENTTLQLQALSAFANPDADVAWKPWYNGYGQYTLKYSGTYDTFITSNAVSWRQMGAGFGCLSAGLGGGCLINDYLTLHAEMTAELGTGLVAGSGHNLRSIVEVLWAPSPKWDIHFKAAVERFGFNCYIEDPSKGAAIDVFNAVNMGATVCFYPLRDCQDLKLRGTVSYNDTVYSGDVPSKPRIGLTIGVIYDHVFHLKK